MKRLLTCLAFLSAAPGFSQGFEVTALAGYTTPGSLEQDTRTLEDLKLAGSFTWGASLGYFFSPRLGLEASWLAWAAASSWQRPRPARSCST
jgi:hypothetical protein